MLFRGFCSTRVLAFLALGFLGLLFFGPVIRYPFVHDDVVFIQANSDIARWDNIVDSFVRPGVPLEGGKNVTPYYRPMLEVLYRLQFLLFGMSPSGFHLFNVFLHVVNSWLVWLVLVAGVCSVPWIALVLAGIFLLHPVQTQAVACVSGISNLAVTFLLLFAFLCYLRLRPGVRASWAWGGAAGVSFLFALFTKETAVVFPLIIGVYAMLFGHADGTRRRWGPVCGMFALLAAYLVWRQLLFPGFGAEPLGSADEFALRLLAIPGALLAYAGLIVWPADLHYYRSMDILALNPASALWLLSAGLFMAAVLLKSPVMVRCRALFGLGWFLLALLPVLNIAPLINEYSFVQAAEHFLYFPLIGVLLMAAAFLPRLTRGRSRRIMIGVCAGIVLVCGFLTARQLPFWRSEVALFERAARFEPRMGRVRLLLAKAYADAGRFDEAVGEYIASLQIMSEYVKKAGSSRSGDVYVRFIKTIYSGRGQAFLSKGDVERSTADLLSALAFRRESFLGHDVRVMDSGIFNDLALNYVRAGDMPGAEKYFKLAVVMNGGNVEALSNLGIVYLQRKDVVAARFLLERALKIRPGFGPAWESLKRLDWKGIP